MIAAFVGHFSPLSQALAKASSMAGNQVQRKIFQELSEECGAEGTIGYVMAPQPIWPRGPFSVRSMAEGRLEYIGYPNLPVLKHAVFSLRLLARLSAARPRLTLQYNSYLFENLALLLCRAAHRGDALAVIIQDVLVTRGTALLSKAGLLSLSQRASLRLAARFDLIVPISSAIIADFHMAPSKCVVFQGGVTDFAGQLMSDPDESALEPIGVFAGALEPYNGIDRLIDQWIAQDVAGELHVFGRGSLTGCLEEAARRSPRIIFHGMQPEQVVQEWHRKARWNFCLRYSIGIDQTYFFPSKFFNISCSPGAVVVNEFHALPDSLRDHLCVVSDDLSDLAERLVAAVALSNPAHVRARYEIVQSRYSWRSCIRQITKGVHL